MQAFQYARPKTVKEAVDLANGNTQSQFIAGGTNLLDLMKLQVMQPALLIDITQLPLKAVGEREGRLFIGALALNSDVANDERVLRDYPLLAQALFSGASAQLRNMATVGGNLLQRTRCPYFNDVATACNKREPGSGCSALEGFDRTHAILGTSTACIATHPSDMCVALTALDAVIVIQGKKDERRVPIRTFYKEPGDRPDIETVLEKGELILGLEMPATIAGQKARYMKIRDRASYAFALVSAGVILQLDGKTIKDARMALGGVGTRPWHAEAAEKRLVGSRVSTGLFEDVAEEALKGAEPRKQNAFKRELAKRAIITALSTAAGEA